VLSSELISAASEMARGMKSSKYSWSWTASAAVEATRAEEIAADGEEARLKQELAAKKAEKKRETRAAQRARKQVSKSPPAPGSPPGSEGSKKKRTAACKYFRAGRCNKGTSCVFVHAAGGAEASSAPCAEPGGRGSGRQAGRAPRGTKKSAADPSLVACRSDSTDSSDEDWAPGAAEEQQLMEDVTLLAAAAAGGSSEGWETTDEDSE